MDGCSKSVLNVTDCSRLDKSQSVIGWVDGKPTGFRFPIVKPFLLKGYKTHTFELGGGTGYCARNSRAIPRQNSWIGFEYAKSVFCLSRGERCNSPSPPDVIPRCLYVTEMRIKIFMVLMITTILFLLTSNFVLSAPVEYESNTDLPAEGELGWKDKFKSMTSNVKRYFGYFMNKMESDLWLSVAITFVSVFILCTLIYVLFTSARFFSRCSRCCRC
ncbi:uncharacterized protein CEXT_358161 [Caerostris extrusa]|uniref:Uncharacterized protein n=1 Tax=Caerostris extrusa TaxID=172846 RepID=A0AAV4XUZ3_CAEEX|nr:uncharacterized protein CEXT_358161 [Caerostris extrusa]